MFSGTQPSDVKIDEEAEKRKPGKATNAPTDTSTFTGLGLDPLLAAHLKSKRMEIGERPTGIQRTGLPALINGDDSRDVLLHSQTGSGKTLTYLLPILQSLLPLCTETWIDRSVGTLAIILAPTRELARQIYEVAEKLCQLHLSLKEAEAERNGDDEEADQIRRTRWMIPGLLSGGSTKNHEKSRLRKGIPILVATPGRLLDHLQNTSSFDVGKCRWLILDEADRLLEMGFKETLEGILKAMDGRRRLAFNTAKEALQEQNESTADLAIEDVHDSTGVKWWAQPRKVVLCSATLDENVQMLAGTHLRKPQVVRGGAELAPIKNGTSPSEGVVEDDSKKDTASYSRLAAPAQLRQNAVIVPPKLRLVTLIALLRTALSRNSSNVDARRVVVFMSCTDSVEYYWNALGGVKMGHDEPEEQEAATEQPKYVFNDAGEQILEDPKATAEKEKEEKAKKASKQVEKYCELFPHTPVYRLHGSLPQSDRIAQLKGFSTNLGKKSSGASQEGAILLCTSVAARGLDLPSVGCVIQLDPPTEGGPDEYLHRIGRTARVGKDGESWILFLPHERDARKRLEAAIQREGEETKQAVIAETGAEQVLQRGFGGKGDEFEARATEVQLAFERWVLRSEQAVTLARKAFLSHLRAYATHPSAEKDLFHVRFLQLGHLAKSFALREAPATIKTKARQNQPAAAQVDAGRKASEQKRNQKKGDSSLPVAATASVVEAADMDKSRVRSSGGKDDIMEGIDRASKRNKDAEARMYAKVREMGKQIKVGGKLAAYGVDEFQIG